MNKIGKNRKQSHIPLSNSRTNDRIGRVTATINLDQLT